MPQHGKSSRTTSSALSVWMVLPHLRWRVSTVTGGWVNNRYGSVIAHAARRFPPACYSATNCATRNPWAKQSKPLTICVAVSHLIQKGRFGQLRCSKEDLTVPFAGRFHVSKFPDGPHRGILLRRVVLVIDYRFCRSVPSPRQFRLDQGHLGNSIDRLLIPCHPGIFDFSGTRHGRAQCATSTGVRVMSLGAWLVSARQMKSKSSMR
jgi:hypothetical protein